jgi:hypothetical protein
MSKLQSFFNSRRFWVAAGGVAVVIIRDNIPFLAALSDEQIIAISVTIGSWIFGESLRSSEQVAK